MPNDSAKRSRQRKTKSPCNTCGLGAELCICALVPTLNLRTKVVLIIHAKELKRTTNSGRLAIKALQNSEMIVRGQTKVSLNLEPLLTETYESLFFYPSDDAVELTSAFLRQFKKPIQLIVPDGNWRQASKVHLRHKELTHLPRVMIRIPNTAQHHLRREHNEFGMSTLEAVAHALGVIEDHKIRDALLTVYKNKLQQTLVGRGIVSSKQINSKR